jgi:asparagine synthase (glutamine-hydrolysing)
MSGLSGLWYFDSRPLDDGDEAWVLSGLGESERMPIGLWRAPGLLMGQQCSRFEAAGATCAFDGRLDNRKDLLTQLGESSAASLSDSALALRVYQTRGQDGLRDLIGDWSLAIAGTASRFILLASDYAGVRPLYYRRTAECLTWSSSLSHLVRRSGQTQLDEDYIASFLTHGSAAHRTPYRGIYPVPPGRAACITPDKVSTRPFWDLPVDRETRFKDPASYAEQLRILFQEAVAVRMGSGAPVCAELSGGLDSSSIVGMADSLANAHPGGFHQPATFTYTHEGAADEKYVRVVERARGLASIRLSLEEYPLVAADQAGSAAPAWWGPRFTELRRQLDSAGADVFLTGQLGDFVMGNVLDDSSQAVDYLREGRWLAAARETYGWSVALRVPVYPLFWRALRTAYSPWTPAIESGASGGAHSLSPQLLKRVSRGPAEQLPEGIWRQARPGARSRFRALSQMLDSRTLQAPEALQHISYTHPFAHRPLVEFMLTIPPAEVCRPGEPRRLMRQALAGILPPAILQRKSKATYADVYRQALIPLASAMLAEPGGILSAEYGFVDRKSVTERLGRFLQGLECNDPQLRQLLLFEFWLRNRERNTHFRGTATSILVPRPGAVSSVNVAPMRSARSRMPLTPK